MVSTSAAGRWQQEIPYTNGVFQLYFGWWVYLVRRRIAEFHGIGEIDWDAATLDQSANGGVIIQAIVTLGRALGMSIVIEGVETEEQRVLLRLAGCNEMQGYLFARPMPRPEIDRALAAPAAVPAPPAAPASQQFTLSATI